MRFALIVRLDGAEQFCVPLEDAALSFGRRRPEAQVALQDARITKRHFDIAWNPDLRRHEVVDYGKPPFLAARLREHYDAGVVNTSE